MYGKAKSWWVVGKSFGTTKGSLSHGHELQSHDDASATLVHATITDVHAPVGPATTTPQGFLGDSNDMSLLHLHANHDVSHAWWGSVEITFSYAYKHLCYDLYANWFV